MPSRLPVFVCGTYSDLAAERGLVLDALQQLQLEHHAMELFGARSERPIETCLEEVRQSKIVVVIVGGRYGTLVPGWQISYSEAEYREAWRLNLPCLPYFQLQSGASAPEQSEGTSLLERWKSTLAARHTPFYFTDPHKLAVQVAIDVAREVRRIEEQESALGSAAGQPSVLPISLLASHQYGDEARQLLHGLATDSCGNIVIVGDFWGRLDFEKTELKSAGDRDVFVAKFDPDGACLWSKAYGDESEQVGIGVDIGPNDSIFVASSFAGAIDFGGAPLVSRGRYNVALAKLDRDGRHVWSRRFGDNEYHVAECIAAAPAGWVAVAGRFKGSVDFGSGAMESQSSQTDLFLATFSPNGDLKWARRFGGPHEQQTRSIAIDADGNIGLAGVFKGSIQFDECSLTERNPGDYCGFLAKFNVDGGTMWCKRFGDPFVEQGSVVTFDHSNGDLLTAGFMRNKLPSGTAAPASPVCLFARYDGSGVLRWSKAFGTDAIATSLSVADDGRILMTGYFQGSIDFGMGELKSAGGYDIFAAMFDADGSLKWAQRYGDERHQFLVNGTHGSRGSFILAGSFHGTIDFGGGALVASGYNGQSEGSEDVFLAIFRDGSSG